MFKRNAISYQLHLKDVMFCSIGITIENWTCNKINQTTISLYQRANVNISLHCLTGVCVVFCIYSAEIHLVAPLVATAETKAVWWAMSLWIFWRKKKADYSEVSFNQFQT